MFFRIGALKNFANFTENKLTPTQVFSCKISGIFNNTFLYRRPLVAASEYSTEVLLTSKRSNSRFLLVKNSKSFKKTSVFESDFIVAKGKKHGIALEMDTSMEPFPCNIF